MIALLIIIGTRYTCHIDYKGDLPYQKLKSNYLMDSNDREILKMLDLYSKFVRRLCSLTGFVHFYDNSSLVIRYKNEII